MCAVPLTVNVVRTKTNILRCNWSEGLPLSVVFGRFIPVWLDGNVGFVEKGELFKLSVYA